MRPRRTIVGAVGLAAWLVGAQAVAKEATTAEVAEVIEASTGQPAAEPAPEASPTRAKTDDANDLRLRLDLSESFTFDDQTSSNVSFTDLRAVTHGKQLFGTPLTFGFDGRGRLGHDERTEDRLNLTEAFVGYGGDDDSFRLVLGRQLLRSVGHAEVDGLKLEAQLSESFNASLFGGLMPHPMTSDFDTRFITGGAGYGYASQKATHHGGAAAWIYEGELSRIYLTQRSVVHVGSTLLLSGFAIVDLVAENDPLIGEERGIDPRALHGMVRYRASDLFDTSLALSHHHTILPGKWWRDWMMEERRKRGFSIDGEEPQGTRISSARWTTNLNLNRSYVPYLRLRYDHRHSNDQNGYEARVGFRWRSQQMFANTDYTYRRYFNAENQLIGLRGGYDDDIWGSEAGAVALHVNPLKRGRNSWSFQGHALFWLAIGEMLFEQPVLLQVQYLGFFEPGPVRDSRAAFHTLFAQIGYRL